MYCSAVTIQDYIWWINWQGSETFTVCGCWNVSICCFSLSFIRWSEYFGVLDMNSFTASCWAPGNCDRQSVLNFSLQKPWGFLLCVTVNYLFHVSNQVKKKQFMKMLFFSRKNFLSEIFVSRVVSLKWFFLFLTKTKKKKKNSKVEIKA